MTDTYHFIFIDQQISMETEVKIEMEIDIEHNRYPYCIVWTALPCITCCFPCIGHTGICRSDGVIFDFVGMGPMHSGQLAFGSPLKYLVLDHQSYTSEQWDEAIVRANKTFEHRNHNLVTNNCHHHVAEVLNQLCYKGKSDWGQTDIAFMVLKATHTSCLSYYVYIIFFIILLYFLL